VGDEIVTRVYPAVMAQFRQPAGSDGGRLIPMDRAIERHVGVPCLPARMVGLPFPVIPSRPNGRVAGPEPGAVAWLLRIPTEAVR
jgi:hypothetical protein